MDFSLLLGVSEESTSIAAGIVGLRPFLFFRSPKLLIYQYFHHGSADRLVGFFCYLADCDPQQPDASTLNSLCIYNFRKLLESKGKRAVRSNKEAVTVLDPESYAKRFRASLEGAFVSVPEKFSLFKGSSMEVKLGKVL